MSLNSNYISDDQVARIVTKLNLELTDDEISDVYNRAVGDLEGDLSVRFAVPLIGAGINNLGDVYSTATPWAINKIAQAMICKMRQIFAADNNRNTAVVLENGQRYVDINKTDYTALIKDLMDIMKVTGFQLNSFAEGSGEPVQTIGLGRANDRFEIVRDRTIHDEYS
jgi:hypothetical protein